MDSALQQELAAPVLARLLDPAGQLRSYELVFNIRAVILYKQKTGDNLFNTATWTAINPGEDPERFQACLWAGLQAKHPEIGLEDVGTMVDFSNVVPVTTAIADAFAAHMPREESRPNVAAPAPATAEDPAGMWTALPSPS